MDDILDSLSRKGRKLKDRLRGKKHKPDRTGTNVTGESAGSPGSFLRPEPHVVAGGRDREGNRTSADVQQDRSRDQSPHPEPMPAGGSNDDQQRRKADIDENEASQGYSHLDPDVEVAVGGGPSREVERVHPSPFTGEPDSTWSFSFSCCVSYFPSHDADTSAVLDHVPERKVDVDEKEVSQMHPHLDPDVEAGHSQEVERAHPSPPTEEPDST